jgi:NAD(P)-dependent dehydrogenase (short-subunit alcohol dehydrogenase family)
MTLDKDTIFLITGAAGSIVSGITADLAAASGGTFYLLDLAPEPGSHDPDIERFSKDKDGLKRDLFARIQARGERATPALVEKELAKLERSHAARAAIDAVRAAGGTVHYYSVNLTDADAVTRIVQEVRERRGRIDVLIHAAGLDRSRFLAQKEAGDFDLVFDVKADGLFHLIRAAGDMPVKSLIAFSSIAGRFGNAGQTDYSAANDLLCKIVSNMRKTHPATRAIAIDWTAWGGVGMATRGSIPTVMHQAGIEMLPPEAGIPWIRRELTMGSSNGEIVVAQSLGVLMEEREVDGCLDSAALPRDSAGPMSGRVAGMGIHNGLTIATNLDPVKQPFLYDHQIDGTPVLPGVMGIEAFAEASLWPLPGWHIDAIENVNFLAPFKFYRNEPRQVITETSFHPEQDVLVAQCRLTGSRTLANQSEPQVTTHFTAQVRLTKRPPSQLGTTMPAPPAGSSMDAAELYRLYFHGPAYQVVDRAWWDERRIVAQMSTRLPPNHVPEHLPLAASPRMIELCFQTAGLWEMVTKHHMGLPLHIDRLRLIRSAESAAGPLYAIVTAGAVPGSFDAEVVDGAGNRYLILRGYRTAEFRNVEALRSSPALQEAGV